MIAFNVLDIRRLWLTLRRIISSKSLLRVLAQWVVYLCSFIRSRWRIHDSSDRGKKPTESTHVSPRTRSGKTENICTEDGTNLAEMHLDRNCSPSCQVMDTIPLSDPSIAFSQHSYSFTESPTTENSPHRPIPNRAFSISDPTLPTQPLDNTLAVPDPWRNFDHSAPHLPLPGAIRLNVPASFEALRISRAGSPSRSVIHPLSPVEGPSRMPETLAVGLREHLQRFVPLVPNNHQRYDRKVIMSEDDSKVIELEPLRMDYSDPDPPGWTSYLHPEGVRYFCDIEKRIYTDANLYDPNVQSLVNQSIEDIYDFMRINFIIPSLTADLVLDFVDDKVYYYFAEHKNRSVFYFDKMKTTDFSSWKEVQGASSLTHFGHLIEAEYWWHIFLFPSSLKINEEIVNELRDTVIHGIGDGMTTPFSTITYSNEDLYKLLSVTNSLKENIGTSYGGSICMLSRFMWGFAHGRFLHWHGQPAARLSRDMSAHGPVVKVRSWIMKISSALLFSAPDIHLQNLEKIWVDHVVYEHIWKQSIQKLIDEWQGFTLFSTVLLNANVAFLAIQTIDQNNHPYRSPGQVSSYLSTISSIGSIILSLLLVRVNRTKEKDNAYDAWAFLHSREHPKYGLEILAIVYSLPYALLMWGVVGFLAAIAWMCMADADVSTRVLTGFAWLAIAFLTILCVWMGWESESGDETPQEDSSSDIFSVWREKMLLRFDSRRSSTDSSSRPQWHRLSFMHRRKSKDSEETVV